MADYVELPVLFPTLRTASYTRCDHPRSDERTCLDCGAVQNATGAWIGGYLEYPRRPLRVYERRDG